MIERQRLPEDFTDRVLQDLVDCYERVGQTRADAAREILNRAFAEVQALTMLGNAYDMEHLRAVWEEDGTERPERAHPVVPRMLEIIAKHQKRGAELVRQAGRYLHVIENTGDEECPIQ